MDQKQLIRPDPLRKVMIAQNIVFPSQVYWLIRICVCSMYSLQVLSYTNAHAAVPFRGTPCYLKVAV